MATDRAALLMGRIAMAFAVRECGGELAEEHRALLALPQAKTITTRRKVLARAILRDAGELVPDVISGRVALKQAHRRAYGRARYRAQHEDQPPPAPEPSSAPPVPPPAQPALGPYDMVEHDGVRQSLAAWARVAGFATPYPL